MDSDPQKQLLQDEHVAPVRDDHLDELGSILTEHLKRRTLERMKLQWYPYRSEAASFDSTPCRASGGAPVLHKRRQLSEGSVPARGGQSKTED